MKLRNKKTGELGWLYCDHIGNPKKMTVFLDDNDLSAEHWDYESLAELNEIWEDYKPAEPLIKDENIRKAVRAWAEANDMYDVLYDKDKDFIYSSYGSDNTDISVFISFDECGVFNKLEHRELYSIAELCGEEE